MSTLEGLAEQVPMLPGLACYTQVATRTPEIPGVDTGEAEANRDFALGMIKAFNQILSTSAGARVEVMVEDPVDWQAYFVRRPYRLGWLPFLGRSLRSVPITPGLASVQYGWICASPFCSDDLITTERHLVIAEDRNFEGINSPHYRLQVAWSQIISIEFMPTPTDR